MSFLLTAFLIWGSMHLYAWVRIRAYAGLSLPWAGLLGLLMLLLMAAPVGGVVLSRTGHAAIGRALALVGMVWAGAFFLFFWISVAHDLYNGLMTLWGFVAPTAMSLRITGPASIGSEALLVVVLSLYSVFEAQHILTEQVRVETARLPPELESVRVVAISDIHLGLTVGERQLRRIAQKAREAQPDLLVSLGDLVDAEMGGLDEQSEILADIPAPLGKYAVTGNHEYYAGLSQALRFTRRAGFTVLSNETAVLRPGLTLAGVDDETARSRYFGEGDWDEQEVLRSAPPGDFVLFLKHRPLVQAESVPLMDLQLSGHTHRGQIFPFTLFVAAYYEYGHGLVEVASGRHLYTSRGTGTWGPPMRFLNPPEVTVIDIVRAPGRGEGASQ
ncbi:MAG: metallophosphoesterase [Planctomycetota bacterium]